jgi:hypothetical protein
MLQRNLLICLRFWRGRLYVVRFGFDTLMELFDPEEAADITFTNDSVPFVAQVLRGAAVKRNNPIASSIVWIC